MNQTGWAIVGLTMFLAVRCGQSKEAAQEELPAAVESGDVAKVKAILGKFPELANEKNVFDTPLLIMAMRVGKPAMADAFLKAGAALEFEGNSIWEYVDWSQQKDGALVDVLIKHGLPVDAASKDGKTLLMAAAEEGNHAVVEALVDAGADVRAVAKTGRQFSVLHHAVLGMDPRVVSLLLNKGAPTETQDEKGRTPLALAKYLAEPLPNPDTLDGTGELLEYTWKKSVVEGPKGKSLPQIVEVLSEAASPAGAVTRPSGT